MRRLLRAAAAALLLNTLLVAPVVMASTACVSRVAKEGTLETRYFAAKADLNSAVNALVVIMESPSTPTHVVVKLDDVVQKTLAAVEQAEAARKAALDGNGSFDYQSQATALRSLARQLEARAATAKRGE